MITVVGYGVYADLPSVIGPFDSRKVAAEWLRINAEKLLDTLVAMENEPQDKWTLPAERQEDEYAELWEDDDSVTWWWVVETKLPDDEDST